ncbi:MAG: FtsQ-type POTRA domain-containing protein [Myxococcota bacterium]
MNAFLDRPQPSLLRRAISVVIAGLIGGAVVTVAGLAVHHLAEDARFRVMDVQIVGADRAPIAHLRHLADVRDEQHMLTVSVDAVVQGITRHPWVADAQARLEMPGTLVITVQEHEPVMLLALSALWYVNADGVPFRRAQSGDLDYPILSGLSPDLVTDHPQLASAVIGRALDLLAASEAGAPGGAQALSELRFHQRSGFTLVLRSGTELVLGFSDPTDRLGRLPLMIAQGLDLSAPQRIDLTAETVAVTTPLPPIERR